jgi:2Fe-2S ferredoxin
MTRVVFIEENGTRHEVDVADGVSLMEAARDNEIPGITAECGGMLACGTCHVYLDESWFAAIGGPHAAEAAMLESLERHRPTSRLACQVMLVPGLSGLVARVAEAE